MEPDVESLFLANLEIYPVRNSRLVRVSYDNPDPKEAANAIAKNFINMNLERRYKAATYAKTFLEEQTQQVRANLEDSERRLVAYARDREIINYDDKIEILMEKLKEMSSELIQAEAARILAEANYQEVREDGSANTAAGLGSPVVERFKARKADLDIGYQELTRSINPAIRGYGSSKSRSPRSIGRLPTNSRLSPSRSKPSSKPRRAGKRSSGCVSTRSRKRFSRCRTAAPIIKHSNERWTRTGSFTMACFSA